MVPHHLPSLCVSKSWRFHGTKLREILQLQQGNDLLIDRFLIIEMSSKTKR